MTTQFAALTGIGAPADADEANVVRVLVIDSQPLTRFGLRHVTDADDSLTIVGETGDIATARELVGLQRPNVVTIRRCSGGDCVLLTEELRALHPSLGIVVMSGTADDAELFSALDAGASAFIGPTAGDAEIVSVLRHAAAAPGAFSSSGLAEALRRRRNDSQHSLSPREREVLLLLQTGYSVPAVADELFISASTAKTYVARLYDKLGASNRSQALMAALERGLLVRSAASVLSASH